ncbi:hypothetical protein FRX31_004781 [Thalictrum thalictroides]|uniref:Uncharacterized protein n=1 Tax=Thalictrum thalictroides TaxID=46969 RepID=A0A7J6X9P3_THATH|nr:hypothetical protein FRX31_004781 [Thalictrum thalictroides]
MEFQEANKSRRICPSNVGRPSLRNWARQITLLQYVDPWARFGGLYIIVVRNPGAGIQWSMAIPNGANRYQIWREN